MKKSSSATRLEPSALDDGVPVKVVLDVVGRQHASHLEVSQRESVLLLAQLAEVAWTQKQTASHAIPPFNAIARRCDMTSMLNIAAARCGRVTCHGGGRVAHRGHVWVSWWAHQREVLSGIHVHVPCGRKHKNQ